MNELLQLMHDTMSPVNRIKGSVKLLMLGNLSKDDECKLLSIIDNSSDKLNEVLDAYYVKNKTEKLNDDVNVVIGENSNINSEKAKQVGISKNQSINMKLIKIENNYYLLSNDEIKKGDLVIDITDYSIMGVCMSINKNTQNQQVISLSTGFTLFNNEPKKIIASTGNDLLDMLVIIDKSQIETLLGNNGNKIDYVKSLASKWALDNADRTMETNSALNRGFIGGYNQALQDNEKTEWEVKVEAHTRPVFSKKWDKLVGETFPTIKDGYINILEMKMKK